MDAPGIGIYESDILNYPLYYMYDHGAYDENPKKGKLCYV